MNNHFSYSSKSCFGCSPNITNIDAKVERRIFCDIIGRFQAALLLHTLSRFVLRSYEARLSVVQHVQYYLVTTETVRCCDHPFLIQQTRSTAEIPNTEIKTLIYMICLIYNIPSTNTLKLYVHKPRVRIVYFFPTLKYLGNE